MQESNWMMAKSMIDTEAIESYMEQYDQAALEQVIVEATSSKWSDAVNAMTAIAALVANKRVAIHPMSEQEEHQLQHYEKSWQWMREDSNYTIRKRGRVDE